MARTCLYQLKRCLFIVICIACIIWTINLAVQTLKSSDLSELLNQIPLGNQINRDMVTKNVAIGVIIGIYAIAFFSQLLGVMGAFFESYYLVFTFTAQQVVSALIIGIAIAPSNHNITRLQFCITIVAIIYLNALKKLKRSETSEGKA